MWNGPRLSKGWCQGLQCFVLQGEREGTQQAGKASNGPLGRNALTRGRLKKKKKVLGIVLKYWLKSNPSCTQADLVNFPGS